MNQYVREPINGFTHLAGALLSFVGLLAMVIKAASTDGSALTITAVIIFGVSMILLYSASATYHMVIARDKVLTFLRKLDHSMIFILIAGTYVPFCLISLQGYIGWTIFAIVTTIAVLGIVFKMVWFNCPRWLSTAMYIGMGWIIIIAIFPLTSVLSFQGVFLLVLGGVIYTLGGVVYAIKPKWMQFKNWGFHEIFHIFILLGTLAHFLSVYFFVL